MITLSQVRAMALQLIDSIDLRGQRFGVEGAYHFTNELNERLTIIDDRALSADGRTALGEYAKPDAGYEYHDVRTGKLIKIGSPFSLFPKPVRASFDGTWRSPIGIWTFQAQKWCYPAIFSGLYPKGLTPSDARDAYVALWKPSRHQMLEIQALLDAQTALNPSADGYDMRGSQ
jgi:hypothetical protein